MSTFITKGNKLTLSYKCTLTGTIMCPKGTNRHNYITLKQLVRNHLNTLTKEQLVDLLVIVDAYATYNEPRSFGSIITDFENYKDALI